jgi:TP901 family phage tail tape measure protein
MAEDIRLSVGADTTQMESQIANAARKASVVIRPTIDSKGLEKISAPLGRITGQADEFTKSMEAANARVLAFGASVGVLNAVAKGFQSIVSASTQVEASLKEIQVATGETTGNLEKLGKGIFEIAKSTGLSFKQASEATLEFARQGGNLEDSLLKAKAALVLTRTTGLDAAEAVRGLTAAVLSFNKVGLDYETVVNKLAAVDTKFAVSSRDLIEGISRSASVAQEAGVSFDELAALITTLQEKTARGGAVIGNALKTIFQRVQTTENLTYIRNLGIAVTDVSGEILPATKIIKDLANEFQNLDSATRKGLLIKIGGGFQIDKLAALLNDISNANGTFNRSLAQSTNAGNQGFAKLEELNKTVKASFDRLTTSGTEFASTIGKIAFSEDFKSILNKTSSFLESLNESISGGEEGGATIGKAIVKGIGSIITGPGALLIAGLGIKLFGDLAKFGVDSLKNQLGVTNVKKEQQDIEKSILGLLMQNTAVQTKILSLEGNKTAQAEYLLGLYSKQAATLERMSKLSKDIGPSVYEGGIRLTTEGTKNVKTAADGFMPLDEALKSERKNAPAGSKIILDNKFPFGGGKTGSMVYNSSETRIKNFANGGDAIIPNFAEKSQGKIQTNQVAGLTIGGQDPFIQPRAVQISDSRGALTKFGQELKRDGQLDLINKFSSINFANPIPVGNIYRRGESITKSQDIIKENFRERLNEKLSPQISSVIQSELDLLGITPTEDIQRSFAVGRRFNLVGNSEAGLIFENMVKIANLSSSEISKFAGSDNRPFDIYDLKQEIGKQYFGEKSQGAFKFVEVRSDSSSLKEALTKKYLDEAVNYKPELLNNITSKTAAEGYVPNFAGKTQVKGIATRFNRKIGDVYKEGDAAIRSTFDNPRTALRGTLTGEESKYPGNLFGIKLDESAIVASILGNNMFFGSESQKRTLDSLAIRASSQGATKGKSENLGLGFSMQRLATQPENVISSIAEGKFKKIDYAKLGKVLPRFWKSKGLGEVWEKTKIAAAAQAGKNSYFSNYSDIVNARPDLREFLNNPNAIRDNNKILRDSIVESVLKKDPNIAGFFVDLVDSEERKGLGAGYENVNYLMPFNANPLSNIESQGLIEDAYKQKEEQRKRDDKVKAFKNNGAYYKDFVKNKSAYEQYGRWGNYDKEKKVIYLLSENVKTAAKGYIPNFSKDAVLDAINREQEQSGLPLSAIKVVQDARVRSPKNPNGYAVINNRDEPDGKVPNFAKEDYTKEKFIEEEIRSISKSFTDFNQAVKNATESLNSTYTESFGQIKITAEEVANLLNKIKSENISGGKINRDQIKKDIESGQVFTTDTSSGSDTNAGKTSKEAADAQKEHTKTIQDSLYTLIRYQTVIAGATGALSTLGGGFETFAKTLGGATNTLITLKEGKNIAKEFLGTRKENGKEVQNTFKDLFANLKTDFTKAKGETSGMAGLKAGTAGALSGGNLGNLLKGAGAIAATSLTVASEVYGVIDSVWNYLGDGARKQEDILQRVNESMKDYNLTLSEQAKIISNRGVGEFSRAGDNSTLAGFVNKGTLFYDFFASMVEEGGTKENIRTRSALKNSGLTDTREVISPLYKAISELKVSENKMLPENEQKTSFELEKDIRQQVKNLISENLFGKQGAEFEKSALDLAKKFTPKAQQASIIAKENEPSFGVSIDVVKNTLDTQYQIQKLLRERTSITQDQLSLEKDLLTTNQSRRADLEFQLKILDLEKQKQNEIADIAFEASQNKFSSILGGKTNLTEGQADKLKKAFEELGKVTNLKEAEDAYNNIYKSVTQINGEGKELTARQKEELDKLRQIVERQIKKNEEKKREIALENLKSAISTKLNFIENNKRESLSLELSLGQKRLDQLKKSLDLQNRISDIQYETATMPTPNQDPYVKERSDLVRSLQVNRQRKMQDFEFEKASALQSDRMNALNIAFQRGANASDVSGIVNAKDYQSLEDALQKVLDTEAQTINDRVKEAGDNFYRKTDDAAINIGQKIVDTIKGIDSNNKFGLATVAGGPQIDPLFGGALPKIGLGNFPENISLSGPRETLPSGEKASGGRAENLLSSKKFGPLDPTELINRENEKTAKELLYKAEKRAIDKKIEFETASITNAQKAIDLRKQEREWVQKVKDSAFELYKTQLTPYQAEKQTTFRNIETERTQGIQENQDQIRSAKLQARQSALQTLQSRGASYEQMDEYLSGSKSGGAILKELNSTTDSFGGKVEQAGSIWLNAVRDSAKVLLAAAQGKSSEALSETPAFTTETAPSSKKNQASNFPSRFASAEARGNLSTDQYESIFQSSLNQIPADQTSKINQIAQNRTAAAEETFLQQEDFSAGMKSGLRDIDDQITKFHATLGKQIPMDFRDGLVEAMKALSDPKATDSLKERLMGVATSFLNKINERMMENTANQITQGLFGNGQESSGLLGGIFGGSENTKKNQNSKKSYADFRNPAAVARTTDLTPQYSTSEEGFFSKAGSFLSQGLGKLGGKLGGLFGFGGAGSQLGYLGAAKLRQSDAAETTEEDFEGDLLLGDPSSFNLGDLMGGDERDGGQGGDLGGAQFSKYVINSARNFEKIIVRAGSRLFGGGGGGDGGGDIDVEGDIDMSEFNKGLLPGAAGTRTSSQNVAAGVMGGLGVGKSPIFKEFGYSTGTTPLEFDEETGQMNGGEFDLNEDGLGGDSEFGGGVGGKFGKSISKAAKAFYKYTEEAGKNWLKAVDESAKKLAEAIKEAKDGAGAAGAAGSGGTTSDQEDAILGGGSSGGGDAWGGNSNSNGWNDRGDGWEGRSTSFSRGGMVQGGSGVKDDIPAMVMGGEYIIKRDAVQKYGRNFFDKINYGKIKGYAEGGIVGYDEADQKDLTLNPEKYTPYDLIKRDGLTFDANGKVIGIENYKLAGEEDKSKAPYDIKVAQSDYYANNSQRGDELFFTPGKNGGAIMGQKNLLNYVTQQATSTKLDSIGYSGGQASVDLAGGSANLTYKGITNLDNVQNAQYIKSKEQALDLYFAGQGATKEKIKADEEARLQIEKIKADYEAAKKAQRRAFLTSMITMIAAPLAKNLMSSASQGFGNLFGNKADGMNGFSSGKTSVNMSPGSSSFEDSIMQQRNLGSGTFGKIPGEVPKAYEVGAARGYEVPKAIPVYSWQGKAAGGSVVGNGLGDNVPTMLNGGEFVISKQAADRIGQNNLQRMNSGAENSGNLDEALSRLEVKFEEIIEKVTGVGTININVNSENSNGKSKTESEQGDDLRNKDLARKIKEVVLTVLRDEKRLGGLLR